jgi:hypothetical protein
VELHVRSELFQQLDLLVHLLHGLVEVDPYSGNIQRTLRVHSGNIQGTFREHSGNAD